MCLSSTDCSTKDAEREQACTNKALTTAILWLRRYWDENCKYILVSVCSFPIHRGTYRAIRIMREKNIQKGKRPIFLCLVHELDVSAGAVQVVMEMADGV